MLARGAYPWLAELGVEQVRGDVADAAAVDAAVRGVDGVFHVAARVGYWGPRPEYIRTNIGGAKQLIASCVAAGVTRLVYTSSPSVVIGEGGIEGEDETRPYPAKHLYDYAETKAEAERHVLASSGKGGLVTASIRPHFIFGPGDPQIIPRLVEHAKKGTLVRVGDGRNKVDVTYIDNAVDAHIQCFEALGRAGSPAAGQAYFIGQEAPVELWSFIDEVLRLFQAPPVKKRISLGTARTIGAGVEAVYRLFGLGGEPAITRAAAVILGTSHWFSHAKAARDFGYHPAVGTQEGLRRAVAAAQAQEPGSSP